MAVIVSSTEGDAMKRKSKPTDPEFVVVWRGVQVWAVRARDIDEAESIAVEVTRRPVRELSVAMVPEPKEKK